MQSGSLRVASRGDKLRVSFDMVWSCPTDAERDHSASPTQTDNGANGEKCIHACLWPIKETRGDGNDIDKSFKDGYKEVQHIQGFGPRKTGIRNIIHVADPTKLGRDP